MRIEKNSLFLQSYLNFFADRNAKKMSIANSIKNNDNVQISWRAKRDMRNTEIEKMINSGKPMTGVSYEEFGDYYYDKHGYRLSNYEMEIEYRQALKGSNASLKEKEWRTNPEYRMPTSLFSSPEVTADREAALEKYRNGENLELWESQLLVTFPNAGEGCDRVNEAKTECMTRDLQNDVASALSELGITLSEDDELYFEVWGYEMTVTGTIPDDKLELINEKLAERSQGFQIVYHRNGHIDEAESGGLSLVYLQSAEKFLKEAGGGSVFDIGKDANGNFTGLPDNLGAFIKENAIGEFGIGVSEKYKDREEDIKKALYMRETFNSVIETVQNGDYDRLKNMTCKLTYKNGVLSC